MRTLSPLSSQNNTPPLSDNCWAINEVLLSLSDQYGINVVWAEPVTGSSFTPADGAKNLETKSQFFPLAETIRPLAFRLFNNWKFILRFLISFSDSTIAKTSSLPL